MSHPHQGSLPAPDFFTQTKILFMEGNGRAALLLDNGRPTPKKFAGPHPALDWCRAHRVSFYWLPAEPVKQN